MFWRRPRPANLAVESRQRYPVHRPDCDQSHQTCRAGPLAAQQPTAPLQLESAVATTPPKTPLLPRPAFLLDPATTGEAMGFNSEGPMGAKLSAPLKRPIETTTPGALTPARTSTPPPQTERSRFEARPGASERNGRMGARSELPRHSSLDTDALDSALRREITRPHRDSTPGASPSRKRQRINGDRYVAPGLTAPRHLRRSSAKD